jgi:hypothetical protein
MTATPSDGTRAPRTVANGAPSSRAVCMTLTTVDRAGSLAVAEVRRSTRTSAIGLSAADASSRPDQAIGAALSETAVVSMDRSRVRMPSAPEHPSEDPLIPNWRHVSSTNGAWCRCITKFRQVRQADIEPDSIRAVTFFQSAREALTRMAGPRKERAHHGIGPRLPGFIVVVDSMTAEAARRGNRHQRVCETCCVPVTRSTARRFSATKAFDDPTTSEALPGIGVASWSAPR